MMQWKIAGMMMILPTVTVAIIIAFITFKQKSDEFWINLAICFWIAANSYWMICEFVKHEELKNYAGIAFTAGIICTAYFYLKRMVLKKEKKELI